MHNKNVFSKNLNYYMQKHNKTRKEVSEAIGVSYYTFTDWVKGKKYPRMDKVELLANYFGILKSDLIEDKTAEQRAMQEKSDALASITLQLMNDCELYEMVVKLADLPSDKRPVVDAVLNALKNGQ